MKAYLKKIIIGSIIEKPIRRVLKKNQGSIAPILPFLKKHFKSAEKISVLEIGARYGDSSEVIINNLNCSKYVIIDPYESYSGYENDGFDAVLKKNGGDAIYKATKNRLEGLIDDLIFIRKYSDDTEIIKALSGQTFDLIYIDGNHEYKYVLNDLKNFYPLTKKGGILCGDDFHTRSKINDSLGTIPPEDTRPMVFEAVEEFANLNALKYLSFGKHRGYPKTFAFIK